MSIIDFERETLVMVVRLLDSVPDVFKHAYENGSLCFLLGAFASSASGVPDARQLRQAILDQLLLQARPNLSPIEHQRAVTFIHGKAVDKVRLEALLGAIESEDISRCRSGENRHIAGVARTISRGAAPHPLHRMLHDGLRTGQIPAVFTTNWDCLIEQARPGPAVISVAWDEDTFRPHIGRSDKRGFPGLLGKLHGTADDAADDPAVRARKARSLVHDLRGLGGPLAPNARDVFEAHLRQYPLLVFGYGGYDPDIHVSLQVAGGPVCWVVYPDPDRGRKDGERILRYLPHASQRSVFVFGLSPLRQLFGLDYVPQPQIPSFINEFTDIDAPRALLAIGLSLEHAGHGVAAGRIFEMASGLREARRDSAVQYQRWRHHCIMYGGLQSFRRLRQLLTETDIRRAPVRYHELAHYCELAIENCFRGSMFRLFNTWTGRPLAAKFLRKHVDFERLSALIEEVRSTGSQQAYMRIAAAFVNLTLSSVRVSKTEPLGQKRARLEACLPYARECRAFSSEGHVLRYLGRLSGMMGDPEAANSYYAQSEDRFEAISDYGGVAEVAKYRFKTALAEGTAAAFDRAMLARQYMISRGIRLPYLRMMDWALRIERNLPIAGRRLSKAILWLLRRHLNSPGGF